MANEVSVEITVEEKQALQALTQLTKRFKNLDGSAKKAGKGIDKAGKQVGDSISKGAKRANAALEVLQGTFGALTLASGILAFKNAFVSAFDTVIDKTVELETIQTQFEVLTGSVDLAQKSLEEIQAFSAETPFQFPDLAKAGQLLLSFGNEAENVTPLLKVLGDAAAGSGANIRELALIFGQVQAAGKLTGERLLQLQERAINVGPAIERALGAAEGSIKDLVSAGRVDVQTFTDAFISLTKEGGQFFEATAKRSQTLGGQISTLKDNVVLLATAFGNELLPEFKLFTGAAISFLQNARPLAENIGKILRTIPFVQTAKDALAVTTAIANAAAPDTLEELIVKSNDLNTELQKLQKSTSESGIFGSKGIIEQKLAQQRIESIKKEIAETNRLIIEARDARDFDALERGAKEQELADAAAKKAADNERKKFDAVQLAKEEQRILEEERRLAQQLLDEEITQEQFQKEIDGLIAQKQKIAQIEDGADKESLKRKKVVQDAIAKLDAQQLRVERDNTQKQIQLAAAAGDAINAIAGDNAVAGLIISKAAAVATILVQDGIARQAALAAAMNASVIAALAGPSALAAAFKAQLAALNAAITTNTALSLGIVAAQTVGSLARMQDGGIVPGTSTFGDRTLVRANAGELILNRAQSGRIAEQLESNENLVSEVRNGFIQLSSQPMVIEVEGREIARTVRDELEGGFQLAV